ncbi:MAG: hypothetical protein H6736_13035 [Alphaproteobacteria bacterium]|nr:hypothetical protein [Alphaproteobacteria bacterium]MCB9692728.1 hypothetical protein [Alphaproteobacteria bacterium]
MLAWWFWLAVPACGEGVDADVAQAADDPAQLAALRRASAWSLVRRQLIASGRASSTTVKAVDDVLGALRASRGHEPPPGQVERERALLGSLEGSPVGQDPSVAAALRNVRSQLGD